MHCMHFAHVQKLLMKHEVIHSKQSLSSAFTNIMFGRNKCNFKTSGVYACKIYKDPCVIPYRGM